MSTKHVGAHSVLRVRLNNSKQPAVTVAVIQVRRWTTPLATNANADRVSTMIWHKCVAAHSASVYSMCHNYWTLTAIESEAHHDFESQNRISMYRSEFGSSPTVDTINVGYGLSRIGLRPFPRARLTIKFLCSTHGIIDEQLHRPIGFDLHSTQSHAFLYTYMAGH